MPDTRAGQAYHARAALVVAHVLSPVLVYAALVLLMAYALRERKERR